MSEEIKNKVRKYIIDKAEIQSDDEEFSDDINLYRYGYLDSIDSMSVLSFIESEFGIEVTKEDVLLNNMETINEITQMVSKKLGEN